MTQGPAGDPVPRLATEVASLRREVAELAQKVGDVEGMRQNVDELSGGVADLAERLTRLISSPSLDCPAPAVLASGLARRARRTGVA